MAVEPDKSYRFGDGIRALARTDPGKLLEIVLESGGKKALVAAVVLGEIDAAAKEGEVKSPVEPTQDQGQSQGQA